MGFDGSMFAFAATAGFNFGKKKYNLALFDGQDFCIALYKFKACDKTFSITSENETPIITQWKAGLCFERAPMTLTLAFK